MGEEGYFAAKGDVGDLARQLLIALRPPAEQGGAGAAVGTRLRQRACRAFGWQTAGEQIMGIYRALLGETRAANGVQFEAG